MKTAKIVLFFRCTYTCMYTYLPTYVPQYTQTCIHTYTPKKPLIIKVVNTSDNKIKHILIVTLDHYSGGKP